ncbi:hypothetical protein CHARACLAT_002009 [Characodon lateralis]|uniref:Uncharacterized protein n=1 Tax=Characodon lateralis TaxID=208331 RepID=A0ABU7DCW9_9TELE|nr:hypothetical protein [Characodon lateralis]
MSLTKQDRATACWYTDLKADKAFGLTENIGKQRATDGRLLNALTQQKQQQTDKSDGTAEIRSWEDDSLCVDTVTHVLGAFMKKLCSLGIVKGTFQFTHR